MTPDRLQELREIAGLAYTDETARFIATARTAIPELIAEVERLRGLMRQAHAAMRHCGWHLAPASADLAESDGVLEAAVAEIEESFRSALGDTQ